MPKALISTPAVAPWLVRGVCGRNNAGILSLTEEDVAGETAGSQHHAVLCFNSSGTAALVFNIVALQFRVEAIAFTIGHTDDSAVFVQDEIIELGTRHDLDVGSFLSSLCIGMMYPDPVPALIS